MCNLPDVKFENFVAARSCLQKTLAPTGAIVNKVSINKNQNGLSKWRVQLSASGDFPLPLLSNYVKVRAVLSQHTPKRGVLSTVTLECDYSTTEEWFWEVTYGIKKVSKISKALAQISDAIKTVTPCLKTQPLIRQGEKKMAHLRHLERTKSTARFFYKIRQEKKASKDVSKTQAKPSEKGDVLRQDQSVSKMTRTKKASSDVSKTYATKQFVKGEVLHPTRKVSNVTRTPTNFKPNYEDWDVRSILYSLKTVTVMDAKALSIIRACDGNIGTRAQAYATAVFHLKNRCPELTAKQLPRLHKLVLEKLKIDEYYLQSIELRGDLFERVAVKDHSYYSSSRNHSLCMH